MANKVGIQSPSSGSRRTLHPPRTPHANISHLTLRYPRDKRSRAGVSHSNMIHISGREWQMAGLAAFAVVAAGSAAWYYTRKRPTADEIEYERRETLASFGRIVDGMLLDGFKITTEDGDTRTMILYGYEISGVCYECSQDVTTLAHILDPEGLKLGMPCSIRYQPGSPENSMVVAERWSGLRSGFPPPNPNARPVDQVSGQLID